MESLNKFILLLLGLFVSLCSVFAQKVERNYIRKGNRLYNDSSYIDAEINYRKALAEVSIITAIVVSLSFMIGIGMKLIFG